MKKAAFLLIVFIAFLSGILATLFVVEGVGQGADNSITTMVTGGGRLNEKASLAPEPKKEHLEKSLFSFGSEENMKRDSPFDRVGEDQIHIYKDRVVVEVRNTEWATFTDTHSMEPVLVQGANAIEVVPDGPEEIHRGDIVSYESTVSEGTIIHRVVDIGIDEEGWYCIMKGDNNSAEDPERIRFSQIRRVVVGIIY